MKKKYIDNKKRWIVFCLLVLLMFPSCKKFVQLDAPVTKISSASAFKDNNSATAVLTGLYAQLIRNYFNGSGSSLPATSINEELAADNLVLSNVLGIGSLTSFYQNALEPTYSVGAQADTYWTKTYALLYTINTSISELTNNSSLSPTVAKRLLGEALFLRGFCYFYLTNLYGDVPLIVTSDYEANAKLGRTSSQLIYSQIITDLTRAETLLDNNYAGLDVTTTTTERVRPNLATVDALLARVYLYHKDYAASEASATKVISQSQYSLSSLNAAFKKNSTETIWALQPVDNGFNTHEAQFYLLPNGGPDAEHPAYVSNSLINSFEFGDDRKNSWMGNTSSGGNVFWYPAKYKVPAISGSTDPTEYVIVFRLAEQYLIRAEARNEQGNTTGAIADLNSIRTRSRATATIAVPDPLPNLSASLSQVDVRSTIMKERRVELFAEWGHRWFDLKRSGTIDAVMTTAEIFKGGTWASYKSLYPIPVSDILKNPAITQNPGYTK